MLNKNITDIGLVCSDWKIKRFSEVCDINPSYQIKKGENSSFIDMASVSEDSPRPTKVVLKPYESGSCTKFRNGDVLFARITPCTENGKTALVQNLDTLNGFGSTEFIVLSPKKGELVPQYLYYLVKSSGLRNRAIARMIGTTGRQRVPNEFFKDELVVGVPPLQEQQMISTILTSIDNAIEKTETIIKQAENVKKGLMQKLFTKGLRHTEFRSTELGEIPVSWKLIDLGGILEVIQRPIKMDADQVYQLVKVKRRQGGVVPRERLKGGAILVKNQYQIQAGDFLISKRQIVHGACGIVPDGLNGAIVSNEYHTLRTQSILDIRYLQWFSQTKLMMNYFLISSIGVHIEKMLFKIDDWFKRKIPLPPLDEQIKIANILDSVQSTIETNIRYSKQLKTTKNALMQVLLTGELRVNTSKTMR